MKNTKTNLFIKANTGFNHAIFPVETFNKKFSKQNNVFIGNLQTTNNFLTKHKSETFGYEVPMWNYGDFKAVQDPVPQSFDNGTFICYDLETTGLNNKFDHITEIGAIKVTMKNGKEVKREEFQRFIKQDKPLKPFISKLTHITNEMLEKDGIPESQAIEEFKKFCGDYPCIGHNVLNFDYRFLVQKCREHNLYQTVDKEKLPLYDNCQIDTMEISKIFNKRPNHTLRSMAQDLKITYDPKYQHRAIADVIVNWEVFKQTCIPEFKKHGVKDVKDINKLTENNLVYNSQHKPIISVIYPNALAKSNLIKLSQEQKLTVSNILKHKDDLIITNHPTYDEIISSYINDSKEDFKDVINKYDFISLPPPSFWTNYISEKLRVRVIDLEDKNEALLYNNKKQLLDCVKNANTDELKIKALSNSPIFKNLQLNQNNIYTILNKIDYITNPLCEMKKSSDGKYVTYSLLQDPALAKKDMEKVYKGIIDTCEEMEIPVIIDNEILIPSQEDLPKFREFIDNNPKNIYKSFCHAVDGAKIYQFKQDQIKKDLSFLPADKIKKLCESNPLKMLEQIKEIQSKQLKGAK